MNYMKINTLDIANGEGVGVSLFVSGCDIRCKDCFNSVAWDFNSGHEYTKEVHERFLSYINPSYIERVSILGGEPMSKRNAETVLRIISDIKEKYPKKKIWLYTGYTYENIKTKYDLSKIDVVVDGMYIAELKDYKLKYRGSSNQRIIRH